MIKMGDPIQVKWEETAPPVVPVQTYDHQIYQDSTPKYARASVMAINRPMVGRVL